MECFPATRATRRKSARPSDRASVRGQEPRSLDRDILSTRKQTPGATRPFAVDRECSRRRVWPPTLATHRSSIGVFHWQHLRLISLLANGR